MSTINDKVKPHEASKELSSNISQLTSSSDVISPPGGDVARSNEGENKNPKNLDRGRNYKDVNLFDTDVLDMEDVQLIRNISDLLGDN